MLLLTQPKQKAAKRSIPAPSAARRFTPRANRSTAPRAAVRRPERNIRPATIRSGGISAGRTQRPATLSSRRRKRPASATPNERRRTMSKRRYKYWVLRSPSGDLYRTYSLSDFVKAQPEEFSNAKVAVHGLYIGSAASGWIVVYRQTMDGEMIARRPRKTAISGRFVPPPGKSTGSPISGSSSAIIQRIFQTSTQPPAPLLRSLAPPAPSVAGQFSPTRRPLLKSPHGAQLPFAATAAANLPGTLG